MKRFYAIVAMLICFCMAVPAMADILVLPGNLKVIGEEAFRGNTSLSEVVLPEGVEEIGERAFAESGLTKINLPDSLVSIADNAFDSPVDIEFVANEGTVADEWINSKLAEAYGASDIDWSQIAAVYTSAGKTDFKSSTAISPEHLNCVLQLNETVGGWFMFKAPADGDYFFNAYAPTIDYEYFRMRSTGAGNHNIDWTVYKSDQTQTFVLRNLEAGEEIYWWDAQPAPHSGWTMLSTWYLMITCREKVKKTQITGSVVDASTGSALPGVVVSTDNASVTTDAGGNFSLTVPYGEHTLRFDLDGFIPVSRTINASDDFATVGTISLVKQMNRYYMTFGNYAQGSNGEVQPIEWLVLDRSGSRILLISRYGLASSYYGSDYKWSSSEIRTWLNDTFLNTAFTGAEQAKILETTVDNGDSQNYSGYPVGGSANTVDRIFLLSYAEARKYFGIENEYIDGVGENADARVAPSAYTIAQGLSVLSSEYPTREGEASGKWWLRSPGAKSNCAIYIATKGVFGYNYTNTWKNLVRPAMWIDTSIVQKATISGTVVDAATGNGIEGVTVSCREESTLSDRNGDYILSVPVGVQTLHFELEGYISYDQQIVVSEEGGHVDNAIITKELNGNQYRIVLTWGSTPSDLDSHLRGSDFHIFYSAKTASASDAQLDVDDTSSYGPETVTFTAEANRGYCYYIHDYSNKGSSANTALASSGAKVEIYNGDSLIATRSVPGGTGVYWHVFDLVDGNIEFVDTIGNTEPTKVPVSRVLAGRITLASGDPVADIDVYVRDASGDLAGYTSTGKDGKWSVAGLESGASYQVYYGSFQYAVSGNGESYVTGSVIQATASLYSQTDDTLSFTMKQGDSVVNTIEVGTSVDFFVVAPNADYVRLVVDGKAYESHPVTDGHASFSRVFSGYRNGIRIVQIQSYTEGGGWLGISGEQTLTITKLDGHDLTAPVLRSVSSTLVNTAVDVSWDAVGNAQYYVVYVYGPDGTQLYPDWLDMDGEMNNPALSRTIPGDVFSDRGTYSIQVVATGAGYDSATGSRDISVLETDMAAEIDLEPYVKGNAIGLGDTVFLKVSSRFGANGYTYEITSSDPANTQISGNAVTFKAVGTYVLSGTLTVGGNVCKSNDLTVTVVQPTAALRAEAVENGVRKSYDSDFWELAGSEVTFRLKPNFTPTSVTVKKGSVTIDPDDINRISNHEYTFTASLATENIKEEYTFTLTDCNGIVYGPYCVPVYVMVNSANPGSAAICTGTDIRLYETPDIASEITLSKNDDVEIGKGIYNSMQLVIYNHEEYFVDKNSISTNVSPLSQTITGHLNQGSDLWVVDKGTWKTFTLETQSSVSKIAASVWFIDSADYNHTSLQKQAERTLTPDANHTCSLQYTFSNLGTYYIRLEPDVGRVEQLFITTIQDASETIVYLKRDESLAVPMYPMNSMAGYPAGIVDWQTPMTVLGDAGNNIRYVQFGEAKGFIQKDYLDSSKNQSVRRAYFIIGNAWIDSELGSERTATNTFKKYHQFCKNMGITAVKIAGDDGRGVRHAKQIDEVLDYLGENTDFNDITYIGIYSHCCHDQDNGHGFEVRGGLNYPWVTYLKKISKIKGNVVSLLLPCYSYYCHDSLEKLLEKNEEEFFWDTSKQTLVMIDSLSHSGDSNFGSNFTIKALLSYQEDHCGKAIKKSELEDNLSEVTYSETLDPTEKATDYIKYEGDDNNIVIYPKNK